MFFGPTFYHLKKFVWCVCLLLLYAVTTAIWLEFETEIDCTLE